MNFAEMVNEFSKTLPGTESFKRVRKNCLEIINHNPDQAAAAFLIAGFCRNYVLLYEEEALSFNFAQRNHKLLLGYMGKLEKALRTQDPTEVLQSLNQVICHYSQSDCAF